MVNMIERYALSKVVSVMAFVLTSRRTCCLTVPGTSGSKERENETILFVSVCVCFVFKKPVHRLHCVGVCVCVCVCVCLLSTLNVAKA